MASENESSCEEDPNFAVICAFFEKFGGFLGITDIDICELQSMLESTHEVAKYLTDLHVKLLRKIKKTVHLDKWERSIIKFSHTFCSKDAWEVERFGYKNAKLSTKVRILKELLEAQFDLNAKFKTEINKITSEELRSQPLGRDKLGHAYWFQSDDNYQIRVFREDLDDEKWTLVAKNREDLVTLINTLSDGDIKISSDSAGNEDSNSLSEKPVIDTGQQDTDSKKTSDDEDSNLEKKIESKDEDNSNPIENPGYEKRPREEDDEEEGDGKIFQKYKIKNLEIRVSKITEDPVIGEAIEEPLMRVEGEGSGEDNKSSIVGEAIEEDVMYFYGNGSGQDCQTGNHPEDENKESAVSTSNEKAMSNEKQNEQTLFENKNSNDMNNEPAKNFFFGSSNNPFKDKSVSTMAFGSSVVKKDSDNCFETKDDSKTEKTDVDNKNIDFNGPKASENFLIESKSENNVIKRTESEPKEIIQGKLTEGDIVKKSLDDNKCKDIVVTTKNDEKIKEIREPVTELICSKKSAYICGQINENEEARSTKESNNMDEAIQNQEIAPKHVEPRKNVPINEIEEAKTIDDLELPETDTVNELPVTDELVENKVKSAESGMKENANEISLDSNSVETEKKVISNPDDEESAKVKPDSQSDAKVDSGSDDNTSDVQPEEPEVIIVPRKTRSQTQFTISAPRKTLPIKKAPKSSATTKKKTKNLETENSGIQEENSKANSAESSIPNSPAVSVGDNSVISMGDITAGDSCVDIPEADPLAVSDAEGDPKLAAASRSTLSSFSLDFNDSPNTDKIPIVPSPMRSVRKRGRDVACPKTAEADTGNGKRIKLKGRRPVDTALRKSVEQRMEQLHASSSESKDSEPEESRKSKKKSSRPKKKPTKKGGKNSANQEDFDSKPKTSPIKREPVKKNSRILAGLNIREDSSNDRPGLRQSRRLAQLKIKEQVEDVQPDSRVIAKEEVKKKKGKTVEKTEKPEKRKRDKKAKEEEVSEPEVVIERKKKKKKEKPVSQIFNENRPWQSSSEDSEDLAEEEEEEEIIEEDDAPLGDLKSDHEFSPESDLEHDDDDDEYQPMKRARTAKKESDQEDVEEFPCQKCGKEDHPEWILLCDKCDSGWHCSCLRPPLLVIPEGDWFCPPCQHMTLLEQLQAKLIEYDKKLSKKEVEDRRKERLAYVGISLNNVLPSKETNDHRKQKRRHSMSGSNSSSPSSEESESESASDSDEPIYQLRQRRQAKNYKFNEYDEMMKTAIGEDANKPEDTAGNLGRGKDIQTIVKGLEEPEQEEKKGEDSGRPSVMNLKKMLRKKHRKLNSLEFDSEEEDISDEDFKGTSAESEEEDDEEPEETEDSDDYMGRKRRKNLPVRRSTRARTKRYDTDFVDDDSEDEPPRRKKKKSYWDESDTEESDLSGYGPKDKKKKKKKKKRKDDSDDESIVKKTRPRIRYGGLTSSEEEELGKGRRTRGKKTTYVDTLGSDSEEETKPKRNTRRIESDDEDFVANEEDEVEEDEKDSEEKEEIEEQQEDERDSEQERREKRTLLVPKIYIKKPLGAKKQKELEDAKAKASSIGEKEVASVKEPIENVLTNEGKSEPNNETESAIIKNETITEETEELQPQPAETIPITDSNKQVKEKVPELVKETIPESETANKPVLMDIPIKKEFEEVHERTESIVEPNNPMSERSILELSLTKTPVKRGRKPKVVHEPIISNVNALFKNDDENDDLSEPPGISLPLFDEMPSNMINSKEGSCPDTPKKRRGRGPGKKKSLEESLNSIGTRITPTKTLQPAIEIAAPPQPFSQAQPTPSVITRMLQSKPGLTIYPVGRIRPKQFATMRDDDSDDSSPKTSRASSPAGASSMGVSPNQYNIPGARGPHHSMVGPYRSHGPPHPSMNHYPRGPPPGFRGPPPQQGMLPHPYSHHPSHRSMDPSPSGGGPINLTEPKSGPQPGGPMSGPGRASPSQRGSVGSRYPLVGQTPSNTIMTAARPMMQPYPPSNSTNGPPPSSQPYHPPTTSPAASTSQQPYPLRPNSNTISPLSQQSYHPPPASSNGPPPSQQSYPPPPTSNSGPSQQQPYPTRPSSGNGPPPVSPQAYSSHSSNNGPPAQQQYPPRPASGSGPPPPVQQTYSASPNPNSVPSSQQPYPARPSSNNAPSAPPQSYPPRPSSNSTPQPPDGYYGNYPPPATEEPVLPPTDYQGIPPGGSSPYQEPFNEEPTPAIPPSDNSNSKTYEDETGGEFAGLASYFSSQRDDDLDS